MTAEVAIMNKQGVALAADSAGTIGNKIFNSHNKLFMLSKFHPIGIMIYSSAEVMGYPWETIIKVYRKNLGTKSFATVKEYADDFVTYLQTNTLFSLTEQKKFVLYCAQKIVSQIKEETSYFINAVYGKHPKPAIQASVIKMITERKAAEISNKTIECDLSDDEATKFSEDYKDELRNVVDFYFKSFKLSQEQFDAIYQLFFDSIFKNPELIGETGIVIAGFGNDEVFPAVFSFEMCGVLNGKILKKKTDENQITTSSNRGEIMPFAQEQMVYSFVFGIDPRYDRFITRFFYDATNKMPGALCDALFKRKSKKKDQLKQLLEEEFKEARKDFQKKNQSHQMQTYVNPILDGVGYLPIDELASMAESLVNLTSFKKRITANEKETVGGPIDVAVITKGDGFIWIKRKHYFREEFNKHFFANYYQGAQV